MLSVATRRRGGGRSVGCCTDYIPPSIVHRSDGRTVWLCGGWKGERERQTRFQSLVGGRGVNAATTNTGQEGSAGETELDISSLFRCCEVSD